MDKCEQCIVRQLSALKSLGREELLRVAACKTSRTVRKGETLFEEGTPVNGIYCVKSGACKLTKLTENGRSQTVRLAGAGELLGQRSTISEEPAHLSALALEDMEVCFIPKSELMGMLGANARFSLEMMKDICGDLKEAEDVLVSLAQKTVTARLAQTLLYLADTFGTTPDGALKLKLSREDLAGIVGTAPESCMRLLSGFAKNDYIGLEGKQIRILDRKALLRLQ